MRIALVVVATWACLLSLPLAAAAQELQDLVGTWQVEGWDEAHQRDSEEPYTGTATLTLKGASLNYEGEMDGLTYSGIGIWHADSGTLALQFKETETEEAGVAHFLLQGDALSGNWTFGSDGDHGFETWTRP